MDLAHRVRAALPPGGLFAGQTWRIATAPFPLSPAVVREFESLGRVLLQFYRATNLLYRRSAEGRAPAWVAELLDGGKPASLIALQRDAALRNELPRVIRPDVLVTDDGLAISELDSVPGGIGLTAWLNQTYTGLGFDVVGGARGMLDGFAGIFGNAPQVHIIVSEESATYRPEMAWLAAQLDPSRFTVHDSQFTGFNDGAAAYRFFELFDVANVPAAETLFAAAREKRLRLTPPPRPVFEEKLLLALLWNRNLHELWRRGLGDAFLSRLKKLVPRSWVLDPTPPPPHAGYPGLELTDWRQLKSLSQRGRDLILKVSGFSAHAWGARGVYLGSDLSQADWAAAVDSALAAWPRAPCILQRYHRPSLVQAQWADPDTGAVHLLPGRVRLCPYYFVQGDGDAARPHLGGVLATITPSDKKIVHGMDDAVLAPCMAAPAEKAA